MSLTSENLKIVNTAKHQQHPFHVLGSSRLPVFMATFVGGLALSIIVKLQNISNLSKFLTLGEDFLRPFFNLAGALPGLEIPDETVDVRILQFLTLILFTL